MTKGRLGEGRVRFLAVQSQVRDKLTAGFSYRAVYDELSSDLQIGYQTFAKYVARYVGDVPASRPNTRRNPLRSAASAAPEPSPAEPVSPEDRNVRSQPETPKREEPRRIKFNNQPDPEHIKWLLSRPEPKE